MWFDHTRSTTRTVDIRVIRRPVNLHTIMVVMMMMINTPFDVNNAIMHKCTVRGTLK